MRFNTALSHVIVFVGLVVLSSMPSNAKLYLSQQSGSNLEDKLKNGVAALLQSASSETLDLEGETVQLTSPVTVAGISVGGAPSFKIENGYIEAKGSSWAASTTTSSCSVTHGSTLSGNGLAELSCSPALNSAFLGAVVSTGSMPDDGLARELYVKSISGNKVTLSGQTYGWSNTKSLTFTRFKYLLDFSARSISNLELNGVVMHCMGKSSGIMIPKSGSGLRLEAVHVSGVKGRGVSSQGNGCQGMVIHRCNFDNNGPENSLRPDLRTSIGVSANRDIVIEDSIFEKFLHAVVATRKLTMVGTHFMQGSSMETAFHVEGVVLKNPTSASSIMSSYIDNCGVEWSSEGAAKTWVGDFNGLYMENNHQLMISGIGGPMALIRLRPFHANMGLKKLYVRNNAIHAQTKNPLERLDRLVPAQSGSIDVGDLQDIVFEGMEQNAVKYVTCNPCMFKHTQTSVSSQWDIHGSNFRYPFDLVPKYIYAVNVEDLKNSGNTEQYFKPNNIKYSASASDRYLRLTWPQSVKGTVTVVARVGSTNALSQGIFSYSPQFTASSI